MQSASNHTITRLSVSVLIVGVLTSSDCNRIVRNRKLLSAEEVCRQIKGTFTPPNFCRVMNADPLWSHFPTDLPDDWMCANPPYDKDPNYGSCTDPIPASRMVEWQVLDSSTVPVV